MEMKHIQTSRLLIALRTGEAAALQDVRDVEGLFQVLWFEAQGLGRRLGTVPIPARAALVGRLRRRRSDASVGTW